MGLLPCSGAGAGVQEIGSGQSATGGPRDLPKTSRKTNLASLTKKRAGARLYRSKKLLEMTATDDEVIASWRDRVGTLRKRGRVSAASLAVVPADEIDVRLGRPPAPERLSDEERALGETHLQPSPRLVLIALRELRDDGLAGAAARGGVAQGHGTKQPAAVHSFCIYSPRWLRKSVQ